MITSLEIDEAKAQLTLRQDASQPLVDVLGRMEQLFQIRSPYAPALVCVGGLVAVGGNAAKAMGGNSFSATGNGLTLDQAIVSCLGEAAEILSQFEQPEDLVSVLDMPKAELASGWIGEALATATRPIDWVLGRDIFGKTDILVPADICLRRLPEARAFPVVAAMSSGAAASATWFGAAERAILELVERDAAALWWLGARKPAVVRHDDMAGLEACLLIQKLRFGTTDRVTLLLDLTTDLGIPVVAACSYDNDGLGLACGVAARLDHVSAVRAAILEMAQMELSTSIARLKMEQRGASALNAADRRHLERATLHVPSCGLFEARAPVETGSAYQLGDSLNPRVEDGLNNLGRHLAEKRVSIFLVDHTRKTIGIPVARAVSPDLQPFSQVVTTARLTDTISVTGGGKQYFGDVLPF
jgi:thiazole/oxazole-forming peptide maturase SagD family component